MSVTSHTTTYTNNNHRNERTIYLPRVLWKSTSDVIRRPKLIDHTRTLSECVYLQRVFLSRHTLTAPIIAIESRENSDPKYMWSICYVENVRPYSEVGKWRHRHFFLCDFRSRSSILLLVMRPATYFGNMHHHGFGLVLCLVFVWSYAKPHKHVNHLYVIGKRFSRDAFLCNLHLVWIIFYDGIVFIMRTKLWIKIKNCEFIRNFISLFDRFYEYYILYVKNDTLYAFQIRRHKLIF